MFNSSPPWAVFVCPQHAAGRLQRRTLHVAMAVAPDLGQGTGRVDEGVVRRDLAIGFDAHHLPEVAAEVLRLVAPALALAQRDEEPPVAREHEARAEVFRAVDLGLLAEDHLQPGQLVAFQPRARHRGAVAALAGLAVAQVDQLVLGELRVERNIQQAALAA